MAGATWNCCRLGVLCYMQHVTSLHAKPHRCRVHACLAVICHLHSGRMNWIFYKLLHLHVFCVTINTGYSVDFFRLLFCSLSARFRWSSRWPRLNHGGVVGEFLKVQDSRSRGCMFESLFQQYWLSLSLSRSTPPPPPSPPHPHSSYPWVLNF